MGKKGKGKGKGKGGCRSAFTLELTHLWVRGAVIAAVMCFAAVGCDTLRAVVWPTTVKCLTTPAAGLVEKVQAIVERDGLGNVFSAETVAALEDVARTYGPETVVCILKELIDAYTAPTGMQAPPDRLAAARRAQDFLNQNDIVVQERPQ